MPGSSLWLVPSRMNPLYNTLQAFITTSVPALLQSAGVPTKPTDLPDFPPHLTLTSEIDPVVYGDDPEDWLYRIPFPRRKDVIIKFEDVRTENVFFRRCFIKAELDGIKDAAKAARVWGVLNKQTKGEGEVDVEKRAEEWLEEWRAGFGPHISLAYGDMPIDDNMIAQITAALKSAGIALADDKAPSSFEVRSGLKKCGWQGEQVWLVPTDKPIAEWKPLAVRTL